MSGKILYLSWAIPPDTAGSAIIAYNLAKQFDRSEMVLAGEMPVGKPAVAWSDRWPELVYVQSVWPLKARGLRWWRMLQFPRVLWQSLALVRRHGVDRVVVVYPDPQFLLAGYLTARLSGAHLFAYFHNTYLETRRGLRRRFAAWLQDKVFRHAEHVFVMSEGMSELFRERYPTVKQSPLPHCFHETMPEVDQLPDVHSPLRLTFCGNVNASCIDALVRMTEAATSLPDVAVRFLTGSASVVRQLGLSGPGTICETVSRDVIPERLAEADILLLPHGLTGDLPKEEYMTIFPTKTIEYLISGRPILAHCTTGSYLTRFLREHDCALVIDRPDKAALCAGIEQLRSDAGLRRRLVCNALAAARMFQGPRVAAEFRRWIEPCQA